MANPETKWRYVFELEKKQQEALKVAAIVAPELSHAGIPVEVGFGRYVPVVKIKGLIRKYEVFVRNELQMDARGWFVRSDLRSKMPENFHYEPGRYAIRNMFYKTAALDENGGLHTFLVNVDDGRTPSCNTERLANGRRIPVTDSKPWDNQIGAEPHDPAQVDMTKFPLPAVVRNLELKTKVAEATIPLMRHMLELCGIASGA